MKKTVRRVQLWFLGVAIVCISGPAYSSILLVSELGPSSAGVSASILSPAPVSVLDDGVTNLAMQGFDEAQGVVTSMAYTVDGGGSIAAGTLVDSHMIFLNSPGPESSGPTNLFHFDVTFTFDGIILGVMSDGPGLLESLSTNELGAPGTLYPTTGFVEPPADPGALPGAGPVFKGFGARGIEGNSGPSGPFPNDGYSISLDMKSITVGMSVSEPGDWIRVITKPVPEPMTIALVGLGLAGVGFGAGRRRS